MPAARSDEDCSTVYVDIGSSSSSAAGGDSSSSADGGDSSPSAEDGDSSPSADGGDGSSFADIGASSSSADGGRGVCGTSSIVIGDLLENLDARHLIVVIRYTLTSKIMFNHQ